MRTKLLLGATLLAAGAISAMADNVYSLNVVGYANVPVIGTGYTLVANQLKAGGNTINEVLPGAPNDALVLEFTGSDYVWNIAADGAWYDYNSGEPSAASLNPGKGFFYYNPGAAGNLTFVGEVPQGPGLTVSMPPGYALCGTYTPEALELTAANSFPILNDDLVQTFDGANYTWYIAADGVWYDYNSGEPVTLAPAVGQGWFFYNADTASAHDWVRNFTVAP